MEKEKKMRKFISPGDIKTFRNVVQGIILSSQYVGKDDKGEPIYDETLPKPVIKFNGTVKIHGTNGGIGYNPSCGIWAQSKSHIVTIEGDNAGFAFFVESKKDQFIDIFNKIIDFYDVDMEKNDLALFGEWAGDGVQGKVAVSNFPKRFYIYGAKIAPFNSEEESIWIDVSNYSCHDHGIYNVHDFEKFEIEIDFENLGPVFEKVDKIVQDVEEECPVGKYFGLVKGKDITIGEGVVWTGRYKNSMYRFKTKGEKHSATKGGKKKSSMDVSPEVVEGIREFIEYAVTENRLNQAIEQVFTTNSVIPTTKGTGDFIKWVIADVIKEEMDTMVENNLDPKQINKYISQKAKDWFFAYLDKAIGVTNG
jgi:hypothetical protein